MTAPALRTQAHVLAVNDLAASAAYFTDALGFAEEWRDGENWRGLKRGEVRVMLGACPDALAPAATGDHSLFAFLATDDVDAFHTEIAGRGALIRTAPANKPWGWREMVVATPEGHRIIFAQMTGGTED